MIQKKKHVQDDTNVIEIKKAWAAQKSNRKYTKSSSDSVETRISFSSCASRGRGGGKAPVSGQASRRTSGKVVSRKVMFCLEVS